MAGKGSTTEVSFVERQFDAAYALAEEKENLNKRIKANRDILRTLDTAGELDADQAKLLAEFYPPRKRGDDDDTVADDGNNGDTPTE